MKERPRAVGATPLLPLLLLLPPLLLPAAPASDVAIDFFLVSSSPFFAPSPPVSQVY